MKSNKEIKENLSTEAELPKYSAKDIKEKVLEELEKQDTMFFYGLSGPKAQKIIQETIKQYSQKIKERIEELEKKGTNLGWDFNKNKFRVYESNAIQEVNDILIRIKELKSLLENEKGGIITIHSVEVVTPELISKHMFSEKIPKEKKKVEWMKESNKEINEPFGWERMNNALFIYSIKCLFGFHRWFYSPDKDYRTCYYCGKEENSKRERG